MTWLPKKLAVVPVDFSGRSVDAIREALQLVDSPQHIHALHIVPALDNMSPGLE